MNEKPTGGVFDYNEWIKTLLKCDFLQVKIIPNTFIVFDRRRTFTYRLKRLTAINKASLLHH